MKAELCKVLRGKLTISLILIAISINCGLLFMQRSKMEVLKTIDEFTSENGVRVSEETIDILEQIWDNNIEISWEEYKNDLDIATQYYKNIDIDEIATSYCNLMHLEGKAAQYVQTEFHKLDSWFERASNSDLAFFPPYRMRIFDFITTYLLFAMNLEGVLIAIIITLSCVDFERSSRTLLTVYSTKKGKYILYDKLLVSVIISLLCFLVIVVVTVVLVSCLFSTTTIANTVISNPMVTLKGAPCITNGTITIRKYILESLGISSCLITICSLGSFAVGVKIKNGYYAFGSIVAVLGVMKVFSFLAPTSTNLFFISQYNPLDMILKAGKWFLYSSNNFSPIGYEKYTIIIWLLVCAGLCALELFRLNRILWKQNDNTM